MGLLRSERMKHGTLVLPSDRARNFVNLIGTGANLQIIDMNADSINRPYRRYIQRIDEIERILRFLYDELNKLPDAKVHIEPIENFLEHENEYNLEKVEASLESLYKMFVEFKENNEYLLTQKTDAILEKNVAILAKSQLQSYAFAFSSRGKLPSDLEALIGNSDGQGTDKRKDEKISVIISNIAGVISTSNQERFSRTLFRATRGNAYTIFQSIADPIKEAKTGKMVNKSVFVIYYQGSQMGSLYNKIVNICKAFDANIYNWPQTHEAALNRLEELEKTIEDKEKALEAYEKLMMNEIIYLLKPIQTNRSSFIEELRLFSIKEKSIYSILNLFEGTDITIRANCWFPADSEEHIIKLLATQSNEEQVSAFLLSDVDDTEKLVGAPTYTKVNKFTSAFQNFVNTYGVPRYREANPALLTIITFPFLFGIMYGDIGHGVCLTIFSLVLFYLNKYFPNSNQGEMMDMMISGRYMILLMGLFAVYAGFLYNDFFSIGLDIFGSRWEHDDTVDDVTYWRTGRNYPYPFGLDPKWKGALNELSMTNSFKMKFSVIVGFVQMGAGVILKGTNAVHFNSPLDFFFEFIPQIIFLTALVGYMDFLIIYKWATSPDASNKPMLITTIIDMCMFSNVDPSNELFHHQQLVQKILVILMIAAIPTMLFVKPFIKFILHKMKNPDLLYQEGEIYSDIEKDEDARPIQKGESFDFGEEFIHQMIETIEFVLGTISNTASYLRLWALSLAHQQLALVFYEKTILLSIQSADNLGIMCVLLFIGFTVFAAITFFVMLCMDTLECFLHALRLQWVEFQNKFYKADGYLFTPVNFKEILQKKRENF